MKNALSFDLEFWYSGEPYSNFVNKNIKDHIEEDIYPILRLLNKHKTKATFFVLGAVAEKYPKLIRKIYEDGHEISSHGYSHKKLYYFNKEIFEQEIKKSVDLLKSITNQSPIGFRAPHFSLNNSTSWALSILIKYGFKYDSSVIPIKSHLHGASNPPQIPYKPSMEDITKVDENSKIWEIPMSTINIIKKIPFSNGPYFRLFPYGLLKLVLIKNNKIRSVVFCVHPWEFNSSIDRLNISLPLYILSYYGIKFALKKMDRFLKEFEFAPLKNIYNFE